MDPDTSVAAAAVVNSKGLEERVLELLALFPDGATTEELVRASEIFRPGGLSLVTISPRMRPLVRKGKVEDTGRRRAGESGVSRIVFRLAFRLEACR